MESWEQIWGKGGVRKRDIKRRVEERELEHDRKRRDIKGKKKRGRESWEEREREREEEEARGERKTEGEERLMVGGCNRKKERVYRELKERGQGEQRGLGS